MSASRPNCTQRNAYAMGALSKFCRRLRKSQSGNAMMLVALGAPALVGAGGIAIDTAQWYMWKREL